MIRELRVFLCAGLFVAVSASPAEAGCVGVNCSCSVSASSLGFGTYVPANTADVNVAADISVTCQSFVIGLLISYEVQMGSGVYGSTADRKMSNGGSLLSYNIFTNPARTIVWGNGAGGTGVKNNSYLLAFGASRTDTMQMYGKLPGGQNVSAGSYADMVVVTVVY